MISDEGAKAIALALLENQRLTLLDLGFNDITEKGGKAIAYSLQKNTILARLYLQEFNTPGFEFEWLNGWRREGSSSSTSPEQEFDDAKYGEK
ncbi:uncharacterized protein VTP21DRAFT_9765 [Calcarisporiella thermophila]|uniref:uncharacterized protein n=1 Tax=Calcarisporiella thermophila TaxID=911321 RepID=UPI0037439DA1